MRSRRAGLAVWMEALMAILAFTWVPVLSAQNTQTIDFGASAYGTNVFVGSTIVSGKSAFVSLGCTANTNISRSNTVASVSVPNTITTGAVNTTAGTVPTAANSSADAVSANLLVGLITADEIKAASSTSQDSAGLHVSAAGSQFTNLVVAGIPFSNTPAPNTVVSLLGFGSVTLNEQISSITSTAAKLTVNMIHVHITLANILGIKVGTEIIVSDAQSSITLASSPAILDGEAFGSYIAIPPIIVSGQSAPVTLPCLGSKNVLTNTVLSVNVLGELTTGTVTDTAQGTISPSLATSATTSTVQAINVVSSLVTADTVAASASGSTTDGKTFAFSYDGSSFLNLAVSGHPEINDNVPLNTRVSIAGLGTLWLYRVIQTTNNIEVRMIELSVNQNNSFGIPVGTDVRVADASASLHSATLP